MTMDLECVEPIQKCEEIEEGIAEAAPEEEPEKKKLEEIKKYIRRIRPSFMEFFLLSYLDLFHKTWKETIWWDVYPRDKKVEEEMIHLE